jgi:inorganic pyrophosphatase
MLDAEFWDRLKTLINTQSIVIDRPRGTAHPRYPNLIYPFDYGYLEGTTGGDGQDIDVWVGSGDQSSLTGIVCTVDSIKLDAEIKLLLGCSRAEADRILQVHNSGPQSAILIMNPSDSDPS